MRVLRIACVPNNRFGGMSRTMYCTGSILQQRGHQVEYLFADAIRPWGKEEFHRFSAPLRVAQMVRDRHRAGDRFDIVEIHERLAMPYCRQRRRLGLPPAVLFSYGLEERRHAATLAYYAHKGIRISPRNRYLPLSIVWQARYALRRAQHVICSDRQDIDHLIAEGLPTQRLTHHHSGAEPHFLEAGDIDPLRQRRGILFLGSWIWRKGTLDIIPAITEILRRHPAEHFTVAGCSRSQDEIQAEFAPEIRERIRVIPHIAGDEELIEIYRAHSIFLLPSFFEGWPLVITEAAALGLAIVTTDVCGMRDFVISGQDGFLVPVGAPETIAQRIENLITDPGLARTFGEAIRAKAKTTTWETATDKIERAYRSAQNLTL